MRPLALICDDSPALRTFLRILFELEGYAVVEAATGAEALDLAVTSSPTVAILDVHIPSPNGLELVRLLRHDFRMDETAIVVLTGDTDPGVAARATASGADMVVHKPFVPSELIADVAMAASLDPVAL